MAHRLTFFFGNVCRFKFLTVLIWQPAYLNSILLSKFAKFTQLQGELCDMAASGQRESDLV